MQSEDFEKTDKPADSKAIAQYFDDSAATFMRSTIEDYGGVEVFFVGFVNEDGVVNEVEPLAFGSKDAVPAIEQLATPGSVVIHNHPGGNLEPSNADLQIASRFGNAGVGSYIVDNGVRNLRIIVPVMKPRERQNLDLRKLEALIKPDGPLSRSLPNFEYRPQQVEMLQGVTDAFNYDGIAVIEAGTGTGKSLAYLIPAIHWATQNSEKVIVSTNTINLQEQLIRKDLPFLQQHLSLKFKAELMKGRGNYLCKRRIGFLVQTPDMFLDDPQTEQMRDIIEWANKTKDGSLSDLGFIPDYDVWEQICCDPDNCTRVKCPHYANCFFFMARRRAAAADLVVANHHLVMADLAVRRETGNFTSTAVLPAYKRIVFDEAHNVEDVATRYFGICITRRALSRILARLVHRERSHYGLLPFLRDQMTMMSYSNPSPILAEAVELIDTKLISLRNQLAGQFRELMDHCANGLEHILRQNARPGQELQLRITPDVERSEFWQRTLKRSIQASTEMMEILQKGLVQVRGAILKLPEKAREQFDNPAGELHSLARRLEARVNEFRNFYTIGENRCRWIEVRAARGNRDAIVRLYSLPLDVQNDLNECVFTRTPSVVMTSATLAVEKRFDFFLGQVGLDAAHSSPEKIERINALALDTPFDYERQAFIGVPVDIPEPREYAFTDAACQFLLPALQISRGSAFVLFTSYSQLDQFYRKLEPMLKPLGYTCLRQGGENRQALLQRFKNDRTSILFATASFWEGVDVPGDALRLLVLVKLPFRVPTDPLVQARIERLEDMGEDAFNAYSVPQAVIKFKQGFGRLIRTKDDTGAVLVLDKRVSTKRYGRVFLNSLPSRTVHQSDAEDVLFELNRFFNRNTA
ncbi:MAG: helicase C-terminal domain-containing protein [Candidatus Sumerlaeia bacterium]